ncbi:hypothetical protein VTJ83DRAFT_652 [Remersonia thermophila]|uniref:Zn(2)-C6 fungal-type domain-containing protein n=1 Tax=Remersonia thermophila TaxID=72144 RepID=A0ABR4DMH1_9PEZI
MDVAMSDRFQNPDGVADGAAIFCGFPASPTGLAGVFYDHESVSSSSAPEDEDFFDWDRWDHDQGSNVTVPSSPSSSPDVPTEDDTTAATSLGEALGGPALAGNGGSEDHPMLDAPSPPSPQLANVWPNFEPSSPPRAAALVLDPSPSPPPSGGMTLEPPAPSPATRPKRVLKDKVETNKVRKEGACLPCSMDKLRCDSNAFGVCQRCSERGLPQSACIRKWMEAMLPAVINRWWWYDQRDLKIPDNWFVGDSTLVSVRCSQGGASLNIRVRRFNPPSQTSQATRVHFGIAPNCLPPIGEIYQWMGEQLQTEAKPDFEAHMDRLLLNLASRPQPQPQSSLLFNVLKLRCMLKLWGCKNLYVEPLGSQEVRVPMDFKPVLESLRFAASQVISELERSIVKELDVHRTRLKKTELLLERWVVLWQLILSYRQSLICESDRRQADAAPLSEEASRGRDFRRDTTQLFTATVVTYNQLFTTKETTLKKLPKAVPGPLQLYFGAAWQELPRFHAQVLSQKLPTDDFFISFIVNREQEILQKLSRSRR